MALFLALRFGVLPLWDRWQQERADLPLRETTLLKYRQAVETASSQSEAAQTLETRLREAEAGLLENTNPSLAAAELQGLVKQITTSQAIEVRSSDFLPVKALNESYAQVPLGLQFQCRLDQLVNFLAELQASPKFLTVPRLLIQTMGGKEKVVNVNLTVVGLMRSA